MIEPVHTSSDHSPEMATASLVLGLISVVSIAAGFSVIFGSIGIILALLSRGAGPFPGKAKAGLAASLIGWIGGIVMIYTIFTSIYAGSLDKTLDKLSSLYDTYISSGTLDSSDSDNENSAEPDTSDSNGESSADPGASDGSGEQDTATDNKVAFYGFRITGMEGEA